MTRITRREFLEQTASAAGTGLVVAAAGQIGSTRLAAAGMPTRAFGKTGVRVTIVGLGGGSRFYEPVPEDEQGAEIVRHAIDLGVGVVETASDYGDKRESERRIGMAMRTHRAKVFLETKINARDYDGAMRTMEESLRLLQTDHVDLMLHHYLLNHGELDKVAGPGGAEAAIRKLVNEKVIRFRGFSTHIPGLALDAIARLEPDAIQLPLNATRTPDFEAEVLARAQSRGIAIVAMKTCGHGYFLPSNFTTPDRQARYGAPAELLKRADIPTHKEYLHYALSLPITTAVVGMDSLQTVDGVVANARSFAPMSAKARAALTARAQGFSKTGYWVGETG
jgi:aryl-alcohol dehydrogenase-like predicted oxidoreductase